MPHTMWAEGRTIIEHKKVKLAQNYMLCYRSLNKDWNFEC